MLIGRSCGVPCARSVIHSSSCHSWLEWCTTDAVSGGFWVAAANGSALVRHSPSAPRIAYLYWVPAPMSGTNSSQTPLEPSVRIGCARPSQWLKSPTTRTPRALGAQTANDVPCTGPATLA